MANQANITLCWSLRERQLIQKYGYPFEDLGLALEKAAGNKGIAAIRCPRFDAEQLRFNLAISIKEAASNQLIDELNEIYEEVEAVLAGEGGGGRFHAL